MTRLTKTRISIEKAHRNQRRRSAQIEITTNFASAEDSLDLPSCAGFDSCLFNSGAGILNISGSATLAAYNTLLGTDTYSNSSANPSTLARTVAFRVTDGSAATSADDSTSITLSAVNDAPSISNVDFSLAYSEGSGAQTIDSAISLADVDNSNFNLAEIEISANYSTGEDLLTAASCPGLTCSFSSLSGMLSISGSASLST